MSRQDHAVGRSGVTAIVVALTILLAVGAAAGYAVMNGGDEVESGSHSTGAKAASAAGANGLKPGVPTIMTVGAIRALGAVKGPIYWAGPRRGVGYEVTVTTDGGTYIRYLPTSVEAGTKDHYLTVATYSAINGFQALSAARKRDADVTTAQSGAVIVTFKSAPLSTYFAFPQANFQVEVFSPQAGESRQMTESGAIVLVSAP